MASFFCLRAADWAAVFSLASVYDVLTSASPPLQPNAHTSTMIAKMMFQAVVKNCWATEYAVALAGVVMPRSEATLNA